MKMESSEEKQASKEHKQASFENCDALRNKHLQVFKQNKTISRFDRN
jgi:hypothetical protein